MPNCQDCGKHKSSYASPRCRSCATKYRYATGEAERRERLPSHDNIERYVAVDPPYPITSETIVRCYFVPCTRTNVFARSRVEAIKGYKSHPNGQGRSFYAHDVTESYCRICDININLTGIDLSEYTERRRTG